MKRIEGVGSSETGERFVSFELDGETLQGREGEPLACAMLAAGERVFSRSIKYHRPRGPYCFAAACTQCLLRVDDVPNVYSCQVPLRAGMRVERQNAFPSVKHDLFASIDWVFPRGLDHHEMFAGVPVAEDVMAKVARKLAGLGTLPLTGATRAPAEVLETDVCVVGGGKAGLAACRVLAEGGADFVLLEREAKALDVGGGRILTRTQAIGLYEGTEGKFVLAVTTEGATPRARVVKARRFLLAPGGHPALLPFENNDLPGVLAASAVARLVRHHGLRPGRRAVLVGRGPSLVETAALLEGAGSEVVGRLEWTEDVGSGVEPGAVGIERLKALGLGKVSGVRFVPRGERTARKLACDLIVVCLPPSPSFELARQAGADVTFRPEHGHFAVEADADGRTSAAGIHVAGGITGVMSAAEAMDMGRRAARALLFADAMKEQP